MDNLPSHKSNIIIEFLKERKICTISNAPYMSNFNCIELSFLSIKKITYSYLYNSIDEINEYALKYLYSGEINNTLLLNLKETKSIYLIF